MLHGAIDCCWGFLAPSSHAGYAGSSGNAGCNSADLAKARDDNDGFEMAILCYFMLF